MIPIRYVVFFLSTSCTVALAQQSGIATVRYYNNFDDPAKNNLWMNSNTIVLSSDSTRKYISRTNAQNPYSAGIEIEIPQELKRKNFLIAVRCDVNMKPGAKNQLVISISKNDSAVFWNGFQLGESHDKMSFRQQTGDSINRNEVREWSTIKMSSLIPANVPFDSKIKIYIWNADGIAETDVDEMEIIFTETPLTSFLPK